MKKKRKSYPTLAKGAGKTVEKKKGPFTSVDSARRKGGEIFAEKGSRGLTIHLSGEEKKGRWLKKSLMRQLMRTTGRRRKAPQCS